MGKGGSAPEPPDARETAAAEAQYNRLDTYSPSGSGVRYGFTNADGVFEQGIAPEGRQSAQKYLESEFEREIRQMLEPASVALTERVVDDNINNMPDAPRVQDRGDVAFDIFNRNMSMLQPQMDRQEERLMTSLQARGMPVGSEAFNDAYGEQVQQTQDTMSRLAMDSNIQAGQEQSRLFGLEQAARAGAISELVAAAGGQYNPPNAMPSGSAPTINYSSLVNQQYQAEMNAYQMQQQQRMQTASALGSLGGALIKSTQDAKNVLGLVSPDAAAVAVLNMPILQWEYKPDETPPGDHGKAHIGPMAEAFHSATGLGVSDAISPIDYLGLLTAALQAAILRLSRLENDIYETPSDDDGGESDETDETDETDKTQTVTVH